MRKLLLMLFVLAGCSSTTPYTPYVAAVGVGGEGYIETQVDTNVFRVSFHGNGKTPSDYAEDMTLLRSAEVAKESGYSYFAIVTGVSRSDGSQSVGIAIGSSDTIQTSKNTASSNGSFIGASFSSSKPSTTNMIICYKTKPDIQGGFVYASEFLMNSLYAKYNITSLAERTEQNRMRIAEEQKRKAEQQKRIEEENELMNNEEELRKKIIEER